MLLVDASMVEALLAHAMEASPLEACGVMAGVEEDEGTRLKEAYRVTNAHPEPDMNYTLDPEEHLDVLHAIDDAGLELIGYYHSHPRGPDGPSAIDAARSPWPGVSYVVVSLAREGSITAWRWDGEARRFEREEIAFD
jgi:proteasome lid subunit RPN8/RPN11